MRSELHPQVSTARTTIRLVWIVIMPLVAVGCATQRSAAVQTPTLQQPVVDAAVSPTKLVETRYDVRGYREAANLAVRHEAHVVYRKTRVPITANEELATVPRSTYPTFSYEPLPVSEELRAEIATQKAITEDLRALQTSIVESERRVQAQYAELVRESANVLKVHEQLEADRALVRAAHPVVTAVAPVGGTPGNPPEVKW